MGGGLERRCVGCVYGADLMLLMMGVMYPKHVELKTHQ